MQSDRKPIRSVVETLIIEFDQQKYKEYLFSIFSYLKHRSHRWVIVEKCEASLPRSAQCLPAHKQLRMSAPTSAHISTCELVGAHIGTPSACTQGACSAHLHVCLRSRSRPFACAQGACSVRLYALSQARVLPHARQQLRIRSVPLRTPRA